VFYANEINNFLRDNALYLALVIAFIIVLVILFLLIANRKKKRSSGALNQRYLDLLNALGGANNVQTMEAKGSRLSIILSDFDKIDPSALKALGIDNFVLMTNKITLVLGEEAKVIAKNWSANSQ